MRYENGVQDFDNVTDWLTFITDEAHEKPGVSDRERERGFNETDSLAEAIHLAERGWPGGLERVRALSVKISEELIKVLYQPEVIHDVTGDCLDIGRFAAGEPDEFISLKQAEIDQEPRLLHIVASIGAIANVHSTAMIERGAAVVALIDALESHGKRVIVDCVSPVANLPEPFRMTRVRVKDANAPVQLANLVFLLAHPDSLRRLVFRCREIAVGAVACERRGYGRSDEATPSEQGDIYVKSLYGGERGITQYVLAQLSEQGIYAEKEAV